MSIFILASPNLVDGAEIEPDQQTTIFDRRIAGGVGALSQLPDDTKEMRFQLSGGTEPVLRQELFIEKTGPLEPSPGVFTVELRKGLSVETITHHGICDWVD